MYCVCNAYLFENWANKRKVETTTSYISKKISSKLCIRKISIDLFLQNVPKNPSNDFMYLCFLHKIILFTETHKNINLDSNSLYSEVPNKSVTFFILFRDFFLTYMALLGPTRLFIFWKSCHLHIFLLSKY